MDTLLQDFRYGLRTLARNPAFTAIAIIVLALGIGANTAIFSVVNAVLIRPLPYANPDRLVSVVRSTSGTRTGAFSAADFLDFRDRRRALEEMAAYREDVFTLTDKPDPEQVTGVLVTDGFFNVFQVNAFIGRTVGPQDRRDGVRAVVLSHKLWAKSFNSDSSIAGQNIHLNGNSYTVVGVMPPTFDWPRDGQLWMLGTGRVPAPPLDIENFTEANRDVHYLEVIGRLQQASTLASAEADVDTTARAIEQEHRRQSEESSYTLVPLREELVQNVRTALLVLLGAVACVLLIACANVANLLLARAVGRQREMGIRAAMGAGRGRIIRQLLTESVTLALLGGVAGLLVAGWGIDVILSMAPSTLPRLDDVHLDGSVMLFSVIATIMTGLLFGVVPAIQSSAVDLNQSVKEGGAIGGSASRRRMQRTLIVAEIALSMILVAGAGLMARTLTHLRAVDPGFNPTQNFAVSLALPQSQYRDGKSQIAFYDRFVERFAQLPGAPPLALGFPVPLEGSFGGTASFSIEGQPPVNPSNKPTAALNIVSTGYFRVLGVPIVAGRDLDARDGDKAPQVGLINQAMARQFWPGQDPLGSRINLGDEDDDDALFTIVGIVGDVRPKELQKSPGPEIFLSYRQLPFPYLTAFVRTPWSPNEVRTAFQTVLKDVDRNLPVTDVKPMSDIVQQSMSQPRFRAMLLSSFAMLALTLAAVGIYGLMTYFVTGRMREIGIRLALGAERRDVLRLVMDEGVRLALVGVAVGLAGAWMLSTLVESLLFGVTATDPVTFAAAASLLVGIAAAATYLPARRAMGADPAAVLRAE